MGERGEVEGGLGEGECWVGGRGVGSLQSLFGAQASIERERKGKRKRKSVIFFNNLFFPSIQKMFFLLLLQGNGYWTSY